LVAQPTLYFSGRAGIDHTVAKTRHQPLNVAVHCYKNGDFVAAVTYLFGQVR